MRPAPSLPLIGLVLLIGTPAWAQALLPPIQHQTARLWAETTLDATRWRGARIAPEERTDLRQRLGADAYLWGRGPRLTFTADLEVGSDFGPEPDAWLARPDRRRAVADVYAARLDLRGELLDLTLGRQLIYDVLGADALDGLTARLRVVPFLTLEAGAGLAARRGWSNFGPDVFEPDGAGLSDRPGYVVRGRIATRKLRFLAATAGLTRHFDSEVQREDAALDGRVGPTFLNVNGRLRYAFVVREVEELELGVASQVGAGRLEAGWRRHRPVFSADSIWNAFRREPWQAWEMSGALAVGRFDLAADAALRTYESGPAAAQAPALLRPVEAPTLADAQAYEVGAAVSARVDADRPGARVGLEGRLADGYGGARHYADVYARLPWLYELGRDAVWLRARLGAVGTTTDTDSSTNLAGWGLLAAEWAPEESIRLEALGEVYAGGADPTRARVMLRMSLEDGW